MPKEIKRQQAKALAQEKGKKLDPCACALGCASVYTCVETVFVVK